MAASCPSLGPYASRRTCAILPLSGRPAMAPPARVLPASIIDIGYRLHLARRRRAKREKDKIRGRYRVKVAFQTKGPRIKCQSGSEGQTSQTIPGVFLYVTSHVTCISLCSIFTSFFDDIRRPLVHYSRLDPRAISQLVVERNLGLSRSDGYRSVG